MEALESDTPEMPIYSQEQGAMWHCTCESTIILSHQACPQNRRGEFLFLYIFALYIPSLFLCFKQCVFCTLIVYMSMCLVCAYT